MKRPEKNIFGIDAGMMIATAQIFDTLQLGGKMFYPIAAFVAVWTGWVPLFGQIIGSTVIGAAGAFDVAFSAPIAFLSYPTLWLWFTMKREAPLSGEFLTRKFMLFMACFIISFIPLLNALPDITVWTIGNILFAQHQYKQRMLSYKKAEREEHVVLEERRKALIAQYVDYAKN